MATVPHYLDAFSLVPPATAAAQLDLITGTNFPIPVLAFDASTEENAYSKPFVVNNYGSGNLTVTFFWMADTATSGDVIWGASIAAATANTDSAGYESKAFATAQTVTDTHLGTNADRLMSAALTLSNLDSLASGDMCVLRVYRDSDDAADTMTGDAFLVGVLVEYSDT